MQVIDVPIDYADDVRIFGEDLPRRAADLALDG